MDIVRAWAQHACDWTDCIWWRGRRWLRHEARLAIGPFRSLVQDARRSYLYSRNGPGATPATPAKRFPSARSFLRFSRPALASSASAAPIGGGHLLSGGLHRWPHGDMHRGGSEFRLAEVHPVVGGVLVPQPVTPICHPDYLVFAQPCDRLKLSRYALLLR